MGHRVENGFEEGKNYEWARDEEDKEREREITRPLYFCWYIYSN